MKTADEIVKSLWAGLSPRQQEVIAGRFGLGKFKAQMTLAALGKKYGITRERVRQIEAAGIRILRSKVSSNEELQDLLGRAKKYLKNAGGVAKKERLLEAHTFFTPGLTENHLALALAASNEFHSHDGDDSYHPFYYADQNAYKTAATFVAQWTDTLRRNKAGVLSGEYNDLLKKFVKGKGMQMTHAENFLAVSKELHTNPYGDKGLAEWPEIRPSTIRDRIYLVLKKTGEPMHFETIAETINKAGFNTRAALGPTVHNELIKDPRFVLVGRGMYGLTEQGFAPGTAREVIHRILEKGGPLKPKDVIVAVQKERFLKPNTVLVNLQNKNHFERLNDGRYKVREA